jgi:MFS family permease
MFRVFSKENRANFRLSIGNLVLVANAFIWYLLAFYTLKMALDQQGAATTDSLLILGANTASITISGLVGSLIVGKYIEHKKFLNLWLASGVVLSLIPIIINVANLTQITILSIVFGLYFGLGMPATMSSFATLTKTENRGKTAGMTFMVIGVTFALSSLIMQSSFLELGIFLASLRIIGLITLNFIKANQPSNEQTPIKSKIETKAKYSCIFTNKAFLFYFVPWLMFTLINYTTIPIQNSIYPNEATYTLLAELENIIIALSALVSGFVADKIGRKRLSIIGFILLGIGYAILGLAAVGSANLQSSQNLLIGRITFMFADGIAWGIFYVLFVFTLWGDLAHTAQSDKYYYIGVLPYVAGYLTQLVFTPYLIKIDIQTIFSFASVFLFLAVLPLIYAPETLPEKLMKDRDLKSYIENAQKKAEKQNQKKRQPVKEEKTEPAENDASYEEAKKLAEKYY